MSVRNKFLIILGVIFSAALTYFISTPSNKDLILIGCSSDSDRQYGRRPLAKLLVDEGTPVKQEISSLP